MNLFLQAASSGSPMGSLWMFGLILVVMYFFMIRPQVKKQKDEKKYREEIGKGQKIVTTGGIHGKIVEDKDNTLIIEVEGGNRLKIERGAVSKELSAQYLAKPAKESKESDKK